MTTIARWLFSLFLVLSHTVAPCSLQAQTETENELSVTMIDVNSSGMQGDAHLIQVSGGKTILIDAGAARYAKTKLIPALKKRGIKHLDAVFISHPHLDHYGGLDFLLKSGIKISVIYLDSIGKEWFAREWWGGKIEDIQAIQDTARQLGVVIKEHSEWQEFTLNDTYKLRKILCLRSLVPGDAKDVGDVNDMSLVAALMRKDRSLILYTGDINNGAANRLKADNLLNFPCEILKFPHHGAESWGGEDILKRVAPKIILYPVPATLWNTPRCARSRELAQKLDAQIYSNAEDGEVVINFSHEGTFTVKTDRISIKQ